MRLRALLALFAAALVIWGAPLLGLAVAGQPLAPYLEFPPRTQALGHAPFSWAALIVFALPALGAAALYAAGLARARPRQAPATQRFPWWGWIGLALVTLGWALAWSEGLVPPEWRRQTFTPLWLGYVVTMNALAYRRSGRSPLTHQRRWLLALFPASAAFWWLFEYLNQYTGNWYYSGVAATGAWDYFLQATLPFSTVLPAVVCTRAWLASFARLGALALPPVRGHAGLAWGALLLGALALGGLGLWPEQLFALLWLAPLLVLAGLQKVLVGESLFAPLTHGDWRPVLLPALAALVCGLFWEMWNWGSAAQWHYSVPYVQRFHVFEMPLLGYAGYLPFGVECLLAADLVARIVRGRDSSSPDSQSDTAHEGI
ncbi:MAG: hypothetical protein OEO84_11485 [Betaproteobacteria bacterium]|nr:hypothetical protein [Betaproteobacteria bacterium]